MQGWIVDTSIEYDHKFFSRFRKVSLEEIQIALRDDRHLLNDPLDLSSGNFLDPDNLDCSETLVCLTLYPSGFTSAGFIRGHRTAGCLEASLKMLNNS